MIDLGILITILRIWIATYGLILFFMLSYAFWTVIICVAIALVWEILRFIRNLIQTLIGRRKQS